MKAASAGDARYKKERKREFPCKRLCAVMPNNFTLVLPAPYFANGPLCSLGECSREEERKREGERERERERKRESTLRELLALRAQDIVCRI